MFLCDRILCFVECSVLFTSLFTLSSCRCQCSGGICWYWYLYSLSDLFTFTIWIFICRLSSYLQKKIYLLNIILSKYFAIESVIRWKKYPGLYLHPRLCSELHCAATGRTFYPRYLWISYLTHRCLFIKIWLTEWEIL